MHSIVARQLHEYKVHLLEFVPKAWSHFVTHNTFQELFLSPFTVHEILEFVHEILYLNNTLLPRRNL